MGGLTLDRPDSGRGGSRDGFTLVEVLVTLTILAMVLSGFAMNMARRDNVPTPREKAKEIQAMLYLARSQAISSGIRKEVGINVKARRFAYADSKTVVLAERQKLRIVAGRDLIENGQVSLFFLADGGSSGGEIEITDDRERSATLRINWLTGLPALVENRQ